MPSNTEQSRNRTYLASLLRLMFGTVALLVLFHAEPMFAVSPGDASIPARSENAAVDAGVSAEAELPLCDLTDISLAVAPGSCLVATPEAVTPEAVTPEAVTPEVLAGAAQEAAEVPADKFVAKAAPMCASDGTSIAAPVEIPEIDRGHFEPLPCDAQALLALLGLQLREGAIQLVAARESSPRAPLQSPSLNDRNDGIGALSVPLYWPERAPPSTLGSHWCGGLAWQPGHRSRIDRPPSLRA
jgi:hypothetical protein